MLRKILGAGALVLIGAGSAPAATIVNGGFEDPVVTSFGGFQVFNEGSTDITGWTVGPGVGSLAGTVDIVNATQWNVAEGSQALDLHGTTPGSVSQVITDLIVGAAYTISFLMSGNNFSGDAVFELDVSVGSATQGYSFDSSIAGGAASGTWAENEFNFVASNTSETLSFIATNGAFNANGPAIDDVSITDSLPAVPLPAGGLLLLAGLGGLAALRRRAH